MFRLVIDDVFDLTGGKQEPFMYGSLPGAAGLLFPATVVGSITSPPTAVSAVLAAYAAYIVKNRLAAVSSNAACAIEPRFQAARLPAD
jgi:hypothetical protein